MEKNCKWCYQYKLKLEKHYKLYFIKCIIQIASELRHSQPFEIFKIDKVPNNSKLKILNISKAY